MTKKPPVSTTPINKPSENVVKRFNEQVIPKPEAHAAFYATAEHFEKQLIKEALEKQAKFNEKIVEEAFKKSGGRCQCTRKNCGVKHRGRCLATFEYKDRGTSDKSDAWQAHHRHAEGKGGADSVSNCEILCVPCHKSTDSYSRPG